MFVHDKLTLIFVDVGSQILYGLKFYQHFVWSIDDKEKHSKALTLSRVYSVFYCFYRLIVRYYYDQLFKANFGANSKGALDAINAYVQGFFKLPSLPTPIRIVKLPHKELQTSFLNQASEATL